MFTGMPHDRRVTTKVDQNDMRHSPIERVTTEANSQVSDGNRHRAGSLQAKDGLAPDVCRMARRAKTAQTPGSNS